MQNTDDKELTDLESLCPTCGGIGGLRSERDDITVRCRRCNGAGYIPTDFGRRVLALMEHNFKPMLEDAGVG